MPGNIVGSDALIGVFIVVVGVVTIRRRTPRAIELAAWIGLIWACVHAVAATRNQQAWALTAVAAWGTTQIAATIIDVLSQGASRWTAASRFALADWAVLILGIDMLALALVSTRRQAEGWQPTIKLRDWMEVPRLSRSAPAAAKVSALDEISWRLNVLAPVAVMAMLIRGTLFLIRSGDIGLGGVAPAPAEVARVREVTRRMDSAQPLPAGRQLAEPEVTHNRAGRTKVKSPDRPDRGRHRAADSSEATHSQATAAGRKD